MSLNSTSFKPAEKHFAWKGEDAGYSAKHYWVYAKFGKANKCENKECTKKFKDYEWHNISGRYRRERSDWEMLCQSCHKKKNWGDYCKKGHHLSGDNLRPNKNNYRICKTCAHIWYLKKIGDYNGRGRFRRKYKTTNRFGTRKKI